MKAKAKDDNQEFSEKYANSFRKAKNTVTRSGRQPNVIEKQMPVGPNKEPTEISKPSHHLRVLYYLDNTTSLRLCQYVR